ncbi:MAG: DUF4974 domain-containing protein [Balneolaceae bacterium]|nr:MAG: DUF4974 domain-containing protein [Balneolaceae bacterium]
MNRELAEKYLNNRAIPVEAEEVLRWFRTPEGEKYLLNKINRDASFLNNNGLRKRVPELDSGKMYESVWSQIQSSKKGKNIYPVKNIHWLEVFIKSAAAILVVAFASYFTFLHEQQKLEIVVEHEPVIFQTGSEENLVMRLSDGTTIRLNSDSELVVSDTYLNGTREILLNGEAYFDVQHDPETPFIIRGNQSIIEVLGTEFNVRSYPGHSNVQVAVVDGMVSFSRRGQGDEADALMLKKGQYGYLDIKTGRFETDDIAIENYLAWKNGSLGFDHLSLDKVCQQIYRLYGAYCAFEDNSISSLLITARFADPSLEKALEVIAMTLNIRYQLLENRITWSTPEQT